MLELVKAGGFTTGGFNFDAKVRRQSVDPEDLFHAHVGGVDALARALLSAAAVIEDGRQAEFVRERYAGWTSELGRKLLDGEMSLAQAAQLTPDRQLDPQPRSGRQEYLENLISRFT
jgi:xylose isomerase